MKCGLDFGTTNSSISILKDGIAQVIKIDTSALDPRVIRSMIYFEKREMLFDPKMPKARIEANIFQPGEIEYLGKQQYSIGQKAVNRFMEENKNRHPGIERFMLLTRWYDQNPRPTEEPAFVKEIDYGVGRLLQALKSTLKTSYKGTAIFGKFYTVEELIAILIGEIKKQAELKLKEKIDEVTCGRPVIFSDDKKLDQKAQSRLLNALKLAGFKKVGFTFEPLAAAKQFLSKDKKDKIILVFDFGGGTLDTATVKLSAGKEEILSTDGVYIGGDLLNADIMEAKLFEYFGSNLTWGDHGLNLPSTLFESLKSWFNIPSLNNPQNMILFEKARYKNSDPKSLERLVHLIKSNLGFEIYEAIEIAKKELTTKEESYIQFQDGPINLRVKITRKEFENIINGRIREIKKVILRTVEKADLKSEQINKVVRTGGSSLIPIIEDTLSDIFSKDKIEQFETFTSISAGLVY